VSAPPKWALDTLDEAWRGLPEYDKPTLTWRRSKGKHYSSGRAFVKERRIVVTAGSAAPRWEQKTVLLHEIAHAMCPRDEHHGELFYTTAWSLFRRFNLPVRAVLRREEGYRKMARVGYNVTKPTTVSTGDSRTP
jgi:hypothetical protein